MFLYHVKTPVARNQPKISTYSQKSTYAANIVVGKITAATDQSRDTKFNVKNYKLEGKPWTKPSKFSSIILEAPRMWI
jgi:hypothetical protein